MVSNKFCEHEHERSSALITEAWNKLSAIFMYKIPCQDFESPPPQFHLHWTNWIILKIYLNNFNSFCIQGSKFEAKFDTDSLTYLPAILNVLVKVYIHARWYLTAKYIVTWSMTISDAQLGSLWLAANIISRLQNLFLKFKIAGEFLARSWRTQLCNVLYQTVSVINCSSFQNLFSINSFHIKGTQ